MPVGEKALVSGQGDQGGQGFVGVFKLNYGGFHHQGEGVELLGDFVLTTEGQFEVAMGKPGIGQHFDD